MGLELIEKPVKANKSKTSKAEKALREDLQKQVDIFKTMGWEFDIDERQNIYTATLKNDEDDETLTSNASVDNLLEQINQFYAGDPAEDAEAPLKQKQPEVLMRQCRVVLEDADILERNSELMKILREKDEENERFDHVKESHKERIKELDKDFARIRHAIDTRSEYRDVECSEIYNFETWTVTVVRRDTNEQVEKRPMTMEERQSKLF
jgi:hypothetical protein